MMNTTELTEYIKNYLENDRTRSAIMLTGEWGCGKSYYIQNILTNELNKNNQDLAVVSLYGIKSIADLNKSIYLELRAKKAIKKISNKFTNGNNNKSGKFYKIKAWFKKHGKEVASGTLLVGKTIVKGVAGFFNVPVEYSDKDLERLFASINLDNKLIVLEDLERSGIDIIEIMGYVNNLVEQDGIKVLLVANEDEIIKYEDNEQLDKENEKKAIKVPTSKSREYLRIKEKTVSDTIPFYADLNSSVENLIKLFNSKLSDEALKTKTADGIPLIVEEIACVMLDVKCSNFRALLYSCQKTLEMFLKGGKDYNIQYFMNILCSNTAFALKLSQNSNLKWTDNLKSPTELVSYKFPLYKCCYDYMKTQYFDREQFEKDEEAFIKQKDFDVKQKDLQGALDILYNFYELTETETSDAVRTIYGYLTEDVSYFPLTQYGKLANYLIAVRQCVDDEKIIDDCKEQILKKTRGIVLDSVAIYDLAYHNGIELWTAEQRDEYNKFMEEFLGGIKADDIDISDDISSPQDIQKLVKNIRANSSRYIGRQNFAQQLDIDGLLKTLPKCNAKIICELRGTILGVYSSINIKEFLSGDKLSLVKLKEGIGKLLAENKIDDKVKKLQLEWFVSNLSDIIQRLE